MAESTGQGIAGAPDPAALAALHQRLLSDRSLQFEFRGLQTQTPTPLPTWLRDLLEGIGRLIDLVMPVLRVLFWIGAAALLILLVYVIVREIAGVRFARRRRAARRQTPVDWRPDPVRARALLENADRLAAQGRFDQAVRLILHRSIDEIETRRPRAVRPALTARDIAALEMVPPRARTAFARIAAIVEFSAFAGRPIGESAFAQCRAAYEAFAFPEAWA